jgi:hypothetical protein
MEKTCLLPLPKFYDRQCSQNQEAQESKDFAHWSAQLKRLRGNSSLWTQTIALLKSQDIPTAHPIARIALDRAGQSLLHLAVLEDHMECISLLCKDKELAEMRNQFGLTPFELALYLHKSKTVELFLGGSIVRNFIQQPNVRFEGDFSGFDYLPQPIYESREVLDEILEYTSKAKKGDGIGQDRIWLGVYYDKEIQKRIHPRLTVRWIDDTVGYGVFARERILPCTFLGEYTGVIQQRKPRHEKESIYSFLYTSWQMGRRKYVVDAERMGNFTRFINHSDQPSAEALCVYWRGMPRMIFVSLCEIQEGAQIHFDYGTIYWKQLPHLKKQSL